MNERVAIVGTGAMGAAVAGCLLESGVPLTVFNRTPARAAPLVERGARLAATPATAATGARVVISLLADDAAVRQATLGPDGIIAGLGADAVHLSMSTISPALSAELAAEHALQGRRYLAAPTFGRPIDAAARRLRICLAGDPDAKEVARPVLELIGEALVDFGDVPEHANVAKLAGNFLLMATIEALAEAIVLGEANGVPAEMLLEVVPFVQGAYQRLGAFIAAGAFEQANFRLALGHKDARLVLAAAEASGAKLPVARLVEERFARSMAAGRADHDWTALSLDVRETSGRADAG